MINEDELHKLIDEKKKTQSKLSVVTSHLNFHAPKAVRAGLTRIQHEIRNMVKEGVSQIEPTEKNLSSITELLDLCKNDWTNTDLDDLYGEGNPIVCSWIDQNNPEFGRFREKEIVIPNNSKEDYEGSGNVGKPNYPSLD